MRGSGGQTQKFGFVALPKRLEINFKSPLNRSPAAGWHPCSLMGECSENPQYMKANCAPVCQSCNFLEILGRCPLDALGPDVWEAGDLDRMFRRLSTGEEYRSQYSVEILSSPETHDGGPWVLTMDNVVTEEEAARLIELGALEGYVRSTDVGELLPDGSTEKVVSPGRTSTNAWCMSDECTEDRHVRAIMERITNMTRIPKVNSEHFQLLKYETGQL
jgi:prolyl 4-hydroxylase